MLTDKMRPEKKLHHCVMCEQMMSFELSTLDRKMVDVTHYFCVGGKLLLASCHVFFSNRC